MKKFVLVAALVLFAVPSFALTIVGTQHDLSSQNLAINAGGNDEVCVYCHTPHGADTSVALAPLWNRSTVSAIGAVYGGLDLNAATVTTPMTLATINATDAPLCLSCHGGNVGKALNNPPNVGTLNLSTYNMSANAGLTTDMSNDHPIGFRYDEVIAVDVEFNSAVDAAASGAAFFAVGNEVWCSSCHDVHDNVNGTFLRANNAKSALCLACHIK